MIVPLPTMWNSVREKAAPAARLRLTSVKPARFQEILDRLLESHLPLVMLPSIRSARRGNAKSKDLSLRGRVVRIKARAHQHLFRVKSPAFLKDAVVLLPANLVLELVGDGDLQKVPRYSLVAENRSRVFDGRANIKITALRIVGRNKIEAARVLSRSPAGVINPPGIVGLKASEMRREWTRKKARDQPLS